MIHLLLQPQLSEIIEKHIHDWPSKIYIKSRAKAQKLSLHFHYFQPQFNLLHHSHLDDLPKKILIPVYNVSNHQHLIKI